MSPPNSYVEILTLKEMVLRGGVGLSGRRLGQEAGAVMNAVSPLQKELQRALTPATGGHREKTAVYEPGSGFSQDSASAGALISAFPASGTMRNGLLLFKPPSPW